MPLGTSARMLGAGMVVVALLGLTLGSSDMAASAVPTTAAAAVTSTTTSPLPPLSAEIGEPISVVPSTPPTQAPPVVIAIEAIGLGATPVRPVGLDGEGQLEIPNESEVGWYRFGSWPGRPGATVLAAHVSWNDTTGPFYRLVDLEPGALISVTMADETMRSYTVIERTQYRKTELPSERVWTLEGPETLVLITCGGDFNEAIRRYRHNIVVYAVPAS